ncbi:multicopper oxidase domain-containing protein [Nocardia pulmonis]|uniref:multicopper oxidase domain-containing protein n=1 Tax=Nocardia pulmonis TaxID=2951408 RepID=UPI003FD7106F
MRFETHADPTYPYMYHCHLLPHEDRGMMGQFLVLGPGQTPNPMALPETGHRHGRYEIRDIPDGFGHSSSKPAPAARAARLLP